MNKKTTAPGTNGKAKLTPIRTQATPTNGATYNEQPSAATLQLKTYEEAVRLFSESRFVEACKLFTEAAAGPAAHIADKARTYVQVCERRTASIDLKLTTAEDHFNYGVERLNARDVERARTHLEHALRLDPAADHVLYTMALCCGMDGDGDGACENLKRAIDLEPRNRILAKQDPEFAALASQLPALRALLGVA